MKDLKDDIKIWSLIRGLVYSEVSYHDTVRRIEELRAIEKPSSEEAEALKQLEGVPEQDIRVMAIWIARLKEMGVDFLSDPQIPEIRRNLLGEFADRLEAQRTVAYAKVMEATTQADLDEVVRELFVPGCGRRKPLLAGGGY